MTPTETMLRGWLDDPAATADQKHHARARLAVGTADVEAPPPAHPLDAAAEASAARRREQLARADACPDRRKLSCCGCDADCRRGRGPAVDWPNVGPVSLVTLDQCLACLDGTD